MDYFNEKLNTKTPPTSDSDGEAVQVHDSADGLTGLPVLDTKDLVELLALPELAYDFKFRRAYFKRLAFLTARADEVRTEQLLNKRLREAKVKHQAHQARRGARAGPTPHNIVTESADHGEMDVDGDLGALDEHENVDDYGGEESAHVVVGQPLHLTQDGSDTMHSLTRFFERPISIYDSAFATSTEYNIPLKVWNLWSKNPAIRAKLSNYSFFRGQLHLRVAVSGTPFHYGRLMISYQPYAVANATLQAYDTMFAATTPTDAAIYPAYKAYLSQAPGIHYIDIKENEPVEIDIPFISYKQVFRLYNPLTTVITNATDFEDFEEAGELRIVTLNQCRVANEDYDSEVSINVYAWMTDVHLGCITGTNIDITAEAKQHAKPRKSGASKPRRDYSSEDVSEASEEAQRRSKWQNSMADKPMYGEGAFHERLSKSVAAGGDEYKAPGPVQMVATAVSGVGDALSDIPVIGGFAKATSAVAKSVGKIAEWFGWSKPPILEKAVFVKNNPFVNGAHLMGHETTYKITCDPKQELSVDQSPGGTDGCDDMAIKAISARESFLTTFTWSRSDTAMTTVLWRTLVTPTMVTGVPMPSSNRLTQLTPLAFAVVPFHFWRGRIKYRFEIVCSKFHRGKLLFRYEPNIPQSALIESSSAQLNQQNTTILDLQQAQDITFVVDWARSRSWLSLAQAPITTGYTASFASLPDTSPAVTHTVNVQDDNWCNGLIEVRAINELVQPTDDSNVYINVYVSCDDLEVAVPTAEMLPLTRNIIVTESAMINETTLNPTNADMSNIHLEHFGEKVESFRSLLKRYACTNVAQSALATSASDGAFVQNGLHYPPMNCPPGDVGSTTGSARRPSLWSYLRPAYMGMRGGMRHRVISWGPQTVPTLPEFTYVRCCIDHPVDVATASEAAVTYELQGPANLATTGSECLIARPEGTVTYHKASNGGVEFETPFYSNNIFMFAFSQSEGTAETNIVGSYSCQWYAAFMARRTTSNRWVFETDTATGEDFTFLRFQGAPFVTTYVGP